MFREFKKGFNYPQIEKEVLEFWKESKIFQKSVESRANSARFVFYEGPPTANGKPGIHHVISRTIKDLVCRYKTMQGFRVDRKAGWDTHGLPVEIEVEKELGLTSKAKIEEYGIAKFNAKCRESVFKYKKDWDELSERIGYWLDLEDYYITCSTEYIESVWWILAQYFKQGLIYQGHKILPYCPRCGTGLSSHEVAQGYEEVSDPSVFVRFKLSEEPDSSFLVWTTTPWTLISNVSLAVNPEFMYVKVSYKNEKLILAEALCDKVLSGDYKILEKFPGKALEKKKYQPLFEFVELDKNKAYYVTLADFVSLEEGTGIVHIAPAFGQDDYNLGQMYQLPMPQPVDESGKFSPEVTAWKGMFIKEADPLITQDLKNKSLLFKEEKYTHTYPFCWRCDSPLIYYARKSWYIKTTAYKDRLLNNNKKINWYPADIGSGRFGEWLENNVDWALSRERYWGTPLNIWICDNCSQQKVISSIEELKSEAVTLPEELDFHKPLVDEITFKCNLCSGVMHRTPEVIDCWFDSGSMPYAQWHFPFQNKENFQEKFPADFISEGLDQTRGWFYSLLSISSFLFDQPAYKNVIVIEFIQDKFGQKMSKSRGNVVDAWDVLNNQGADALRWYLLTVSQPWIPTKFDLEQVTEVVKKFLGTLSNTYAFFALYANIDKFDPNRTPPALADRPWIDRWIISRLNSLVKNVRESMDKYDLTRAGRMISEFVIDELSNWYVRRNRKRFWQPAEDTDKLSAYFTLWEVLVKVFQISAPFAPFITEVFYRELVTKVLKEAPASVHLSDFPSADEKQMDLSLEEKMADLVEMVYLGRAARNQAKIKIRQPLEQIFVGLNIKSKVKNLKPLTYLVAEELNVKKINFVDNKEKFTKLQARPNFELLGPKLGKNLALFTEFLNKLSDKELEKFQKKGELVYKAGKEALIFNKNEIEIVETARVGYAYEASMRMWVALDLKLTADLENEGFARELVNKVQNLRKNSGLEVTDRIKLTIQTSARLEKAIKAFQDYIKKETLSIEISFNNQSQKGAAPENINGEKAWITLDKVTRKAEV